MVRESGLVVNVDYSVWGWAHMLLGVLAILVAAGLLAGNTVARVVGVVLAMVSAIVNIVFLPAYPWWSTLVIVFDVLVIYGLTAHGGEMKHRPLTGAPRRRPARWHVRRPPSCASLCP